MPDDNTLSITPDQFAALQPDSKTALLSQLQRAGYSQDQLAQFGGGGEPPPKTPAALPDFLGNGVKAPADPALVPSSRPTAAEPYEKRAAAIHDLVTRGILDSTQAAQVAKAEGVSLADLSIEAPAPAERPSVEEANERLAASTDPLAPALSPDDFHFQFDGRHLEGLAPDEVRDINDMFANALHQAAIPRSLGQGLVTEMMNSADRFMHMDDTARAMAFKTEGQRLLRMGNVNEIIANAELAWNRLPQDFKEVATEHHLFHAAEAYNALANAGAMVRQRDARKAEK